MNWLTSLLLFVFAGFLFGNVLLQERTQEKGESLSSDEVQPTLGPDFGVTCSGVIREIEEIEGGSVSSIKIDIESILVYTTSGNRRGGSKLQEFLGKRLKFYEEGSFSGFPADFWPGDCPIATRGEFRFYSTYVFLAEALENGNAETKSGTKEEQQGIRATTRNAEKTPGK